MRFLLLLSSFVCLFVLIDIFETVHFKMISLNFHTNIAWFTILVKYNQVFSSIDLFIPS